MKISHRGFLTDVCVYQTSTAAAVLLPEMSTYVIADGCAAKSMDKHNNALDDLAQRRINVISTLDSKHILKECAKSSKESRLSGSDEWLMIEKIFSASGVGRNESMDVDTLKSLMATTTQSGSSPILTLTMMGLSSSITRSSGSRSLTENLGKSGETQLSRSQMHEILFKRKPRSGCLENLPLFILLSYLPFLYSVSTRIPFIFVALEITQGRGGEFHTAFIVSSCISIR